MLESCPVGTEPNSVSVQQQQVLLPAEPSLQLSFLTIVFVCFLVLFFTNSLYPLAITLEDLVIGIIFLCLHVVIRIMILSKF